jgi:hypothetical protein
MVPSGQAKDAPKRRTFTIFFVSVVLLAALLIWWRYYKAVTPAKTSANTTQPTQIAQCPDTPSQVLLPLQPSEPGYATDPHLAPPPNTIMVIDAVPMTIPYNKDLRAVFDIPEYHDCQRLMRQDKKYGPLAGVFSLAATHPAYTRLEYQRLGGAAVAMIYNFSGTGPAYMPGTMQGVTTSMTDSTAFDRRTCLYLKLEPDTSWTAQLWPLPSSLPTCPGKLPKSVHTLALDVIRSTPSAKIDDYPPAARWDFDRQNNLQYVGVPCLEGWCEVGPQGFESSDVLPSGDRNHTIKGWYDQQYLASIPVAGGAHPSVMYGTLYPEADLRGLTIADYSCDPKVVPADEPFAGKFDRHLEQASREPRSCGGVSSTGSSIQDEGHWVKVASIHIPQPDSAYRRKFMLNGEGDGFVYLRYDPNLPSAERWHIRYAANATGLGRVRVAKRVDHSMSTYGGVPIVVPSTVRWRWVLQDEYTWNACSIGCCNGFD